MICTFPVTCIPVSLYFGNFSMTSTHSSGGHYDWDSYYFSYGSTLNCTLKILTKRVRVPHLCPIQTRPNLSKYVSIMPQTPYPATVHACSCKLTQKSGYSVCPSVSSLACPSNGFEAGSFASDHTFARYCADARALVDSVRACAGARSIDDDDEGGSVAGS